MDTSTLTELASAYPFAETLQRLHQAIEAAGLRVFAEIDHAAAATSVEMVMPPTTVLIYGNPRGGTPLMHAAPLIALDLPLRVLVHENAEGKAMVVFHQAQSITRAAGLPDGMAAGLQKAEAIIVGAIKRVETA